MALWLYISNRENPSLVQDFPDPVAITLTTLPDGLTLGNQSLGEVFLRIRRTDPNAPVSTSSFHAFVDLTGLKPGVHRVPVQVVADPGIDVVGKKPAAIAVTLERKEQRRVPVRVEVLTRPPKGYGSSISFKPKSATVSGPADLVGQVTQATAYIDLGTITSTISGVYRLNAVNNSGSEVGSQLTLSPPNARVIASVKPFSSYKTLPVLVEFSGLPKQGFGVAGVQVNPAEIAASGSPASLSKVSSVQTSAISVNHRSGGTFKKTVRINLPHGVSSHSHSVTVKVRIAPIQSSTSVEIGIQPKNVAPGLVMHTVPARVLVTVTGPANELHNVADSTYATVDLSGRAAGVYQLRPTVKSSRKGLEVEAVYPKTVTVQVRSTS